MISDILTGARILTWVLNGLSLALCIQLSGLLLGYEARGRRAVNILLVLLATAPAVFLSGRTEGDPLPYPARIALFCIYAAGQAGCFCAVYRKANLRLLYMFLLTVNLPQIFQNVFWAFTGNVALTELTAFAASALLPALLIIVINRRGHRELIRDVVRSLPARAYISVLIFSYVASISVVTENSIENKTLISLLRAGSMIALIAAAVSIIRISVSESEKRASVELLARQMENRVEYYEKIDRIYGEFRSFRHDYKNHVLCLRGLIAAGRTDEALEYMETMLDMSSVEKNRFHTGNVIIDALLDDKSEAAAAAHAELIFTGSVPDRGITNADLCVIIANAIDNAIEACAGDESGTAKQIKLEACVKQGYFFFKAENPVFGQVDITDRHSIATTKSDREHHGFGVANIVRTAEKYEGEAAISSENGVFTLEVLLQLTVNSE